MPTLTTTIEDTSPAIIYSQSDGSDNWVAGSSKTDTSLDSYSDSSYTVTNVSQASASFSFYGTGVQVFGSKRPSHGFYQISIDAIVYPQVNGGVNDTQGQFNAQLFSTVALAPGYHTVKMTNLGTANLDLDYVTWQTPIGEVDDNLKTITLQDTDPAFAYSPASNWFNTPSNLGLFSGGTGHATSTAGSSFELKFKVDAIAIYGPITPNGAAYSVSLDGATATNYSSATRSIYKPQQILYQAGNLQGAEHTLKIQSEAWDKSGSEFIVDYAMVYTTSELESSGSALSKGAIIGVAIGGFFFLVIIALTAFFCFRFWTRYRKYAMLANKQGRSDPEVRQAVEPFQQRPLSHLDSTNSHTALLPATSYASLSSRHRSMQSAGQPQFSPPPTATAWSPPPGTHIIYSTSADPIVAGPNTQVITIPFTPEGKYRPDLQTPNLGPVPEGVNPPESTAGSSSVHSSGWRSQSEFGAVLPAGAQPPLPHIAEEVRRMPSTESAEHNASRTASPAPHLQPLRPGAVAIGTRTPPEYQSDAIAL
ncbi:hypothetical protein CPB83DRAFT_857626 [Crepidotus variabilis]|uniref:Transmembrane protein n=1 Tax=Crepidotus variabilis TaxID=179855 RepID=A0A9P6JMN2_9AGAR|nr:hypothetical protein CPB83DRAFT_857626 [Crepidotus variabilis]